MPDAVAIAGWTLVLSTVLGLAPVANPALLSIWTGTREHHLVTVLAHTRAWAWLNAGFVLATLGTTAGLLLLGVAGLPDDGSALVLALAVAYGLAGTCWIAVLGIRTRLTPALARLDAAGSPTQPTEDLLGAVTGGLFAVFAVGSGLALAALGGVLLVAAPDLATTIAAWACVGGGLLVAGVQARTGDVIPAVLYLPTLVLGVALLLR